jgi:hypothetical protein
MDILVEGSSKSVSPVDVEVVESVRIKDRALAQPSPHAG